jgi:hypothetical protein
VVCCYYTRDAHCMCGANNHTLEPICMNDIRCDHRDRPLDSFVPARDRTTATPDRQLNSCQADAILAGRGVHPESARWASDINAFEDRNLVISTTQTIGKVSHVGLTPAIGGVECALYSDAYAHCLDGWQQEVATG